MSENQALSQKMFMMSDKDGILEGAGVRFERILDHPVERVWEALTKPEALAAWLAPARVEAGVGGTIRVETTGGPSGGRIREWKENDLLEYDWFEEAVVRWELLPEGPGRCRLIFTCRPLPKSLWQAASVGWHFHLDALALSLEGKGMTGGSGWIAYAVAHWEDISRAAAARYGQQLRKSASKAPASAPFVIERTFDAPVARVWKALTDVDEIGRWSFTVSDFKPEPGRDFSFYGETETRRYLHLCRITEIIPERKLAYSWRYEDIIGISHVSFELFPEGDKTRLRLTHEGLENLAHAGPDFVRSNFEAGWTAILDKGLAPLFGG
jgi:uncharacterized protein YndB with AHSA1/START domain